MTQFTVIAYRPNGLDTCRGCEMGRSDSDFDIKFFCHLDDVAEYIANKNIESNESDREYCGWDIYTLVDGLDADSWYTNFYNTERLIDPELEDPDYWTKIDILTRQKIKEIREDKEVKKQKELEELLKKQQLINEKALALKEEQERLQYLKLREKYGSEF